MSFSIELRIEDARWRKVRGLSARLRRSAEVALRRGKAPRSSSLTILLTSDTKSQLLNRDFRGKNRPTNVLSFPASPTGGAYLGDIALAYGVTSAEARAGDKRLAAHAMHLTVHGVLHLLGFGHETKRAAHIMEPLEVKILAELGIGNPYAQEAA